MITIIAALIEAIWKMNYTWLYLGTVVIDIGLIIAMVDMITILYENKKGE